MENRALVVLTRDEDGNRRWAEELARRGLATLSAPMIKTVPAHLTAEITTALQNLRKFDWLVLTSPRAVKILKQLMRETGAHTVNTPPVAAVGPGTAAAARRAMLPVRFIAEPATAETLAADLTPVAGRRILVVRANLAGSACAQNLTNRGADVTDLILYHTRTLCSPNQELESRLQAGQIRCFTFASPSSIEGLTRSLTRPALALAQTLPAITFGPGTTNAAHDHGFNNVCQAAAPDMPSLISAIRLL